MINNITLTGRLTATPEMKTTPSGNALTTICIAVDRRYQQAGAGKETDFINCVAWRGTAEFICKYFNKGDMIALVGELQTRKYDDKDGNKRTAYEVVIKQASFCGGKNNSKADDEAGAFGSFTEIDGFSDDELPFQ